MDASGPGMDRCSIDDEIRKSFCRRERLPAGADIERHRVAGARARHHYCWRQLLQWISRSDVVGILVQQDGSNGPSVHRKHIQSELEWLSAGSTREARRHLRQVRPQEASLDSLKARHDEELMRRMR